LCLAGEGFAANRQRQFVGGGSRVDQRGWNFISLAANVAAMSLRRGLILICLSCSIAGCNAGVAQKLSEAPNLRWPIRGKDAPQQVLDANRVALQLRVNVGPPPASLSAWVINPIAGPGSVSTESNGHVLATFQFVLTPQSRPSTRPDSPAVTRPDISPKATVFLLHGLGDDKQGPPYEFYALCLAGQGYRVVLVDLRGHGRSTGDRITYGARESEDLVQLLDAMERDGLIAGEVGVIGVSYGGSVAICWAGIDPRVRAVVALEPFSSLRDAALDAGPIVLGSIRWMFSNRDLQDIATRVGKLGGFDPDRDSPIAAIARCSTPVLLIHGSADDFLRPAHSVRLHQAAPTHSQLILVDGANHLDLWIKGFKTIMEQTDGWFTRYLTPQSPTTRAGS
jgi:pimeloyl-ACP methyl ester carboxylesterase